MSGHAKDSAGKTKQRPVAQQVPGVIRPDEIYTLTEALQRLGWTTSAFRAAKRRGLNVLVCGKRRYLSGEEIKRFLERETAK